MNRMPAGTSDNDKQMTDQVRQHCSELLHTDILRLWDLNFPYRKFHKSIFRSPSEKPHWMSKECVDINAERSMGYSGLNPDFRCVCEGHIVPSSTPSVGCVGQSCRLLQAHLGPLSVSHAIVGFKV
jgi:hypothetical protein